MELLTEKIVSSNNVNIFKNNFDRFEKINKKNMIDKYKLNLYHYLTYLTILFYFII